MNESNEIFRFDYHFDRDKLLELWHNKYSNEVEVYDDPRVDEYINRPEFIKQYGHWSKDVWQIARIEDSDYANEIIEFFGVNARPRFYLLKANEVLPYHDDRDTTCAINFILSDEPAPISFMDTKNTHYYKTALLNTTLGHGVWNGPKDRLIFKLSVFDEDFETVKHKIEEKLSI